MSINIVSSLDSGKIASLLEVFAIFLGLLIAANLQSIVGLAARRRLYSRGTARLCDSTWNVGVLQGVANPRRLLRDARAFLAFLLALAVICLEVLTVLQTKTSKACAFGESSTWKIRKSDQKCFAPTPEIESHRNVFLSSKYMDSAKGKVREVDLGLGIPVHTNVFEDSIISGKAVRQIKEGGFAERYTTPIVDIFENIADIAVYDGIPLGDLEVRTGPKNVYTDDICETEELEAEKARWFPRGIEHLNFRKNGSTFITAATGFVEIRPCLENLLVRVCDYVGGRKEFSVEVVGNERWFEVQCRGHVIFGKVEERMRCHLSPCFTKLKLLILPRSAKPFSYL